MKKKKNENNSTYTISRIDCGDEGIDKEMSRT